MTDAITISQLAKQVGLSRSTLLYYDRLGLLRPGNRSRGDYRLYDGDDLRRLRRICLYRNLGIPLKEIAQLLGREGEEGSPSADILQRHLGFLESQIESLQHQQRQVIKLLDKLPSPSPGNSTPDVGRRKAVNVPKELPARSSARASGRANVRRPRARPSGRHHVLQKENEMITKQRWVEIMRAAGLDDDAMRNWHRQFESLEPDAHQEFLESLGIAPAEIKDIRAWSKK